MAYLITSLSFDMRGYSWFRIEKHTFGLLTLELLSSTLSAIRIITSCKKSNIKMLISHCQKTWSEVLCVRRYANHMHTYNHTYIVHTCLGMCMWIKFCCQNLFLIRTTRIYLDGRYDKTRALSCSGCHFTHILMMERNIWYKFRKRYAKTLTFFKIG